MRACSGEVSNRRCDFFLKLIFKTESAAVCHSCDLSTSGSQSADFFEGADLEISVAYEFRSIAIWALPLKIDGFEDGFCTVGQIGICDFFLQGFNKGGRGTDLAKSDNCLIFV